MNCTVRGWSWVEEQPSQGAPHGRPDLWWLCVLSVKSCAGAERVCAGSFSAP